MDIVNRLIRKYDTRNPFEIAEEMNILVLKEELGSINGYYNTAFRQKFIHINHNLSDREQLLTAAHELGHAILHPKSNTPFLRTCTFLSVNKMEVEANKFAINLLISDDDIKDCKYYTIGQLSRLLGYHQNLIELRLYSVLTQDS